MLPYSSLLDMPGCEETTVYLDADGDGYGDPATAMRSCGAPNNAVENALDCDDENAALSPASDAVCADGIDNDCDDTPDCASLDGRTGLDEATAILTDEIESAAGFGNAIDDLTGDGIADLVIGAPSATDDVPGHHVYIVKGPVMGQVALRSDDVIDLTSEEVYGEGAHVATGDLDGDTYPDLSVGVARADDNGVFIVDGPLSGEDLALDDEAIYLTLAYLGDEEGGNTEVQAADVLSSDGQADLLLDTHNVNNSLSASVFLIPGPIPRSGDVADLAETSLYCLLEGEPAATESARILGDVNGDGMQDLVASAASSQSVSIIFEVPSGTMDIADVADVKIEDEFYSMGGEFLGLGDVDGDGLDDLLAGGISTDDVYWTGGGLVYLYSSALLNAAAAGSLLDGYDDATAIFDGPDNSQLGMSLAAPGDLNEDGYADIFLGDPQASRGDDSEYAGYASLWYGPVEGTVAGTSGDIRIVGDEIGSRTGWRVAARPRDELNNAILLVGTWPFFGTSALYQFTPDGY